MTIKLRHITLGFENMSEIHVIQYLGNKLYIKSSRIIKMLRGLIVLILFTVVDTIFQLKRLNFPCFDTILHSLFWPSYVYLQHFFTGGRP